MKEHYGNIDFYEKEEIGYIELHYLPANKMTQDFFENLSMLVSELREAEILGYIKGIIIKGAGKHFSAGADVEMLKVMMKEPQNDKIDGNLPIGHVRDKKCFTSLADLPIPVISVVSGFCIGSGLELALACKIRIAEKKSKVGFPESTFGFLPALGGNVRAIKSAGLEKALDMVLSGNIYDIEEIENWGLFHYVTEKNEGTSLAKEIIYKGEGNRYGKVCKNCGN